MSRQIVAVVSWLLFAAWFGVLFYLSSRDIGPLPGNRFPHMDKIYHGGYFFVGGILSTIAIAASFQIGSRRLALLVIATVALAGAFDEWHQTRTPGREGGDGGDFVADLTGGALATLIVVFARHGRFIQLSRREVAG